VVKFKTNETVQNVNKGYSRRPRSSTYDGSVEAVLQVFTQSLRKAVKQWCSETGVCKASVHRILRCVKWKMDMAKKKCGPSTLIS
jgi:hypothetical protein